MKSQRDARSILARLLPEQPLESPGDPLYVDLSTARGGSQAHRLANTILDATEGTFTTQLFTGFPGSGKSTELYRLQGILRQEGYQVHFLDVDPYVNRRVPPEADDLLLAVGAAMYYADLGASYFDEIMSRARSLFGSRVSLGGGDGGVLAGKLSFTFEQDPDLYHHFREEIRKQQLSVSQSLREMTTQLQQGKVGRVVLLVDGLEKSAPLSGETERYAEALRAAVIDDPSLRRLNIHIVFTASPLLLPYAGACGRVYSSELQMVPAVRLLRHSGDEYDEGVAKLVELLERRVPLEVLESGGDDVRLAVRASGGYIRDLFRIVREAFSRRDRSGPLLIPSTLMEGAVDYLASETTAFLTVENSDILKRALEHPVELLPTEGQHRLLFALYREPLLLRYRNNGFEDIAHPFVLRNLHRELYEQRVFRGSRKGAMEP